MLTARHPLGFRRWVLGVGLLLTLVSAPAYAHNSRWIIPYEKALDFMKSGKYTEAIPLLEAAIKANPKSEDNKYIEGVYRIGYFPFYYLGVAFFETGDFPKAQENFEKARHPISRALRPKLIDYEQKTADRIYSRLRSDSGSISAARRAGR